MRTCSLRLRFDFSNSCSWFNYICETSGFDRAASHACPFVIWKQESRRSRTLGFLILHWESESSLREMHDWLYISIVVMIQSPSLFPDLKLKEQLLSWITFVLLERTGTSDSCKKDGLRDTFFFLFRHRRKVSENLRTNINRNSSLFSRAWLSRLVTVHAVGET